ncbi:Bacterial regulatory protein, tetR family [Hartmannibacter diazotrophicus]|uniref:Bacterial regulatory protein, tetR family n=1 Tax=Hartmannibacter diazotrophicus TaxID=1482074 RepID=A0A2C9DAZ7_9HYPH|nr:Bacterial regulatory protein, tetR family [Hartmannibacter diazotrophicus]
MDSTTQRAAKTRKSIGARRNPASQEAILTAAQEVLAEVGYGRFSIEAVARRAHAGKPTIYRWWPSRAALLLDVYQRQKRDGGGAVPGTLEDDLSDFLRGLLRFWREGEAGAIFRGIIAEAQGDAKAQAALAAYNEERRQAFCTMIDRRKTNGEVRPEVAPTVLWEVVMGFAWRRLLTGELEIRDKDIAAFTRLLSIGYATLE